MEQRVKTPPLLESMPAGGVDFGYSKMGSLVTYHF